MAKPETSDVERDGLLGDSVFPALKATIDYESKGLVVKVGQTKRPLLVRPGEAE